MGAEGFENHRQEIIILAKGVALELGSGAGHNFKYYKNIDKLYALEPDTTLLSISRNKIKNLNFPIEFIKSPAENIPITDASIDTVISTWTLCSVNNLKSVIDEIRRVLKINGEFIFIEHGISPQRSIKLMQKICNPFTIALTGNCHMCRNILKDLENYKDENERTFKVIIIKQFHEESKFLIHNTVAVATKLK